VSQIDLAEQEARLALQRLPENVASSVRGAVAGFSLEQQREHEANKIYYEKLLAQLKHLTELSANGCCPSRREPNFSKQLAIYLIALILITTHQENCFCPLGILSYPGMS
jgi:hypothetical protein